MERAGGVRGAGSVVEDRLATHLMRMAPEGMDVRWLAEAGICWETTVSDDDTADEVDGPATRLRRALADVGVAPEAVELFARAAQAAGALARGEDLSALGLAVGPPGRDAGQGDTGQDDTSQDDDGHECAVGSPDLGARVAAASGVLDLVGALTGLAAHLDAALVGVVADLSVRNGRILLARRGVADPHGLTTSQARRWRSRTRSVTRREIEALTGWGAGEVSDLVALANAPAPVADPVVASMAAGVTPWRLARRFFRELGHHAHEDAADVAQRLFGTDPQLVCTDRLDPDGNLRDGPWEHKLFHRALERETTRLDSRDPVAAAGARERALQCRDLRVGIDADGTGRIQIDGSAAAVAAVADRIEKAARAARAAGDGRTLGQLRADIALSLLMHSLLDLPAPATAICTPAATAFGTPVATTVSAPAPIGASGASPLVSTTAVDEPTDLVRTGWTEHMQAVLLALPRAVLNVIVPFDSLVHSSTRPVLTGTDESVPDLPRPGAPPGATTGAPEVLSTGLVTGAFPRFLTADAVRELALSPGTTLHRLLTDPADGRCVERSLTSYAPDAAMRAQVHAADVTCRAPGCTQHAPYTQLDHVIAHAAGGPTSRSNLQALHTGHHDPKTRGEWTAVMAANRDVTWTSLLGRVYRTRAHDYRQYSTLLRSAVDRVHQDTDALLAADAEARAHARDRGAPTTDAAGEPRQPEPLTRAQALADSIDRAVYRALTCRPPAQSLRAGEDCPDADTDPAYLGWDLIDLTHTTTGGRRRTGPDPTIAGAQEELLRQSRPHRLKDGAGTTTPSSTPPPDEEPLDEEPPDEEPPPF